MQLETLYVHRLKKKIRQIFR